MKYSNLYKLSEIFYKEACNNLSIIKLAIGYSMPDDDEEEFEEALNDFTAKSKLENMCASSSNDILKKQLEDFQKSYEDITRLVDLFLGNEEDVTMQTDRLLSAMDTLSARSKRILQNQYVVGSEVANWDEDYSPEEVINVVTFLVDSAERYLKLWLNDEQAKIETLGQEIYGKELNDPTAIKLEDAEIVRRIDVLTRQSKYKANELAKRKLARQDPSHPLYESMEKEKANARKRWKKLKEEQPSKWRDILERRREYKKVFFEFDKRISDLREELSRVTDPEKREEIIKQIDKVDLQKINKSREKIRQAERTKEVKKTITIINPVSGKAMHVTDWANIQLEGLIKHLSQKMANERSQIVKKLKNESEIAVKCEREIKDLSEAESRGRGSIAEAAANLRRAVRSHLTDPSNAAHELFTGFALSIRYGKSFRKLLLILRNMKDIPEKLTESGKKPGQALTFEDAEKIKKALEMTKDLKEKFSSLRIKSRQGLEIETFFGGNQVPILAQLEPKLESLLGEVMNRLSPREVGMIDLVTGPSDEGEEVLEQEVMVPAKNAVRYNYLLSKYAEDIMDISPRAKEIFENIIEDESNSIFEEILANEE